ncbi:MAG: calcium-binding protein [Aliishimia sp.]
MFFYLLPAMLVAWGLYELFDDGSSDGGGTSQEELNGEEINAGSGEDLLDGLSGNDILIGGEGVDELLGGEGDDILLGQDDDDSLRGQDGDDLIIGGEGDDALFGAQGADWVQGDAGDDELNGGLGEDVLLGGDGEDVLNGGTNPDVLFGGDALDAPLDQDQLEALRDGTSLAEILGVEGDTVATLTDDGDADVLNGNIGNDMLILGAGDTGTGGTQQDSFLVFADQPDGSEPAIITDLGDTESVALIVGEGAEPVVTVEDDGDDALVISDGQIVARITGAAETIDASDIALVAGPTVNDLDPNFGQPQEPTENEQTLTANADIFVGEDGVLDIVDAGNGDDTLSGLGENDLLRAEAGDDIVLGGTGDDVLLGGTGEDALFGETGNDRITGGSESDWVDGGAGDDQLEGNSQDDIIIGGEGADDLTGGNGADVLVGGDLLDRALTVEELNVLRSDPNSDIGDVAGLGVGALEDGAADVLNGGDGNDALILGAGDTGTGGDGADTFYVVNGDGTSAAIIADLAAEDEVTLLKGDAADAGVVTTAADGNDTLISLDGVVQARVVGVDPGGVGTINVSDPLDMDDVDALTENAPDAVLNTNLTNEDDTFTATDDAVANRVNGLDGDDVISGAGDNDVLRGNDGADILIGGDGDDELLGDAGSDLMQGNGGEDKLLGGSEADWLNGGEGDDELIANAGDDVVIGGDGADDIRGNNDDDLLVGGALFGSDLDPSDLIILRDGGTIDGLTPGELDDGDVDLLDGGNGDDILIGASGDQLTGGNGDDTFMAYANNPTEAVLVNDYDADDDALAVVYDNGGTIPVITVTDSGDGVFTVLADGAPVAVVASTETEVTAADVLLVERNADGSVPLT